MTVSLETDQQRECYELVEAYLTVLEFPHEPLADYPIFLVPFEEGIVAVVGVWQTTLPDGRPAENVCVRVRAWLVDDVPMSMDLMRHLLRYNDDNLYTTAGLDADDSVFLQSSIDGAGMDQDAFDRALSLVVASGLELAGYVTKTWGGRLHWAQS